MKTLKNMYEYIAGGIVVAIFLLMLPVRGIGRGIVLVISVLMLIGYAIFTLFTKRLLTPYPKQPSHPANHYGL